MILMVICAAFGAFLFVGCLGMFLADINGLSDHPVLFDRKHRKVYILVPESGAPEGSSKLRTWMSIKPDARPFEFDWECVEAEHQAVLTGTSASISREHTLMLKVYLRPRAVDPEAPLIFTVSLGNSATLSEGLVPILWEHVRRYMEENGPPLPEGEKLADPLRPSTLWESYCAVSPFSPRIGWFWQHMRGVTIMLFVLTPITLPFFLLWGVFNWLSHKTVQEVRWPDEVLQAVGPRVQ